MGMKERDLYSIGEAEAITGISAKTLRYYDSLNLVVPKIRDPQNKYRYYTKEQIVNLITLQRLRSMGCSIGTLRAVVESNSLSVMCDEIQNRIQEMEEEISRLTASIEENSAFLERLKSSVQVFEDISSANSDLMTSNIYIEEIPQVFLFCKERVMPNYNVCDTSVNFRSEIYKECKALHLKMLGPEITTYYTNLLGQFVMHDCRIRIGVSVENDPSCKQLVSFGGFTAATAIHVGSYDSMINTHVNLLRWISQNHYEVCGEVSEEFLISPIDILEQKNQIIKVIMPVRKTEKS